MGRPARKHGRHFAPARPRPQLDHPGQAAPEERLAAIREQDLGPGQRQPLVGIDLKQFGTAEQSDNDRESRPGGREQEDERVEQIELLLDAERPEMPHLAAQVPVKIGLHVIRVGQQAADLADVMVEDDQGDGRVIEREDPQGPAEIEPLQVGGDVARLPLDQDSRDQKSGQGEEEMNANPSPGAGFFLVVVDEDGEEGQEPEPVDLGLARQRPASRLEGGGDGGRHRGGVPILPRKPQGGEAPGPPQGKPSPPRPHLKDPGRTPPAADSRCARLDRGVRLDHPASFAPPAFDANPLPSSPGRSQSWIAHR